VRATLVYGQRRPQLAEPANAGREKVEPSCEIDGAKQTNGTPEGMASGTIKLPGDLLEERLGLAQQPQLVTCPIDFAPQLHELGADRRAGGACHSVVYGRLVVQSVCDSGQAKLDEGVFQFGCPLQQFAAKQVGHSGLRSGRTTAGCPPLLPASDGRSLPWLTRERRK